MRTRSRNDIYRLFVARNFLSGHSQYGTDANTEPDISEVPSSWLPTHLPTEERTVIEIEHTKTTDIATAEQIQSPWPLSECEVSSSTAVFVEDSKPSQSINTKKSSLPVLSFEDPAHRERTQRQGVNAASLSTTRRASCNNAASSVLVVDIGHDNKKKKVKKKANDEELLPLRCNPQTAFYGEEEDVSSSGRQFAFFRRWRAFSNTESDERVRRLSCTSADADIRPIDFKDVQEVSFGKLLLPEDASNILHERSPVRTPSKVIVSSDVSQNQEGALSAEGNINFGNVKPADGDERAETDAEEVGERGISSGVQQKLSTSSFAQRSLSESVPLVYDPTLLLNFENENAFQKRMLRLNGRISAIFPFATEEQEKIFINDLFRERYPHVNITYSKIKSIKREMLQIARACDVDDLTVAHAYVFYEKVVLKGMVKKTNRKLVAGAALLVATKINDHGSVRLSSIVDHIEAVFRIARKELLQLEIPLCVALDFNLYATKDELLPHYQRISFMEL